MADKGTEFGGVDGLIQPLPHKLTAAEEAMVRRSINPTDATETVEAARIRLAGKRGIANPDGFSG